MILDGKSLAKENEEKLKDEVDVLRKKYNKVPCLATILVGDDPASVTYVRMKENACKRVGIDSIHVEFDKDITQEELITKIEELNNDENVDGISKLLRKYEKSSMTIVAIPAVTAVIPTISICLTT